MAGEDGGGAAAAAGWLAAAARTAGSANGWVSSQADFIVSRRLQAVLHGRLRTLVPVRQYKISTYHGKVGNLDRYSCTNVQEISEELISHHSLGVNAAFTTNPMYAYI